METNLDNTPIRSEFSDDKDYIDLLKVFTEEMPLRMKALQDSYQQQNRTQLKNLAHQMKGTGGGYGFPQLSKTAGKLEQACIDQNELQVKAALKEVLNVMRRITF